MKASDDLFQLIKSLSVTEKGYFKKYASLHGDMENKNYLKLFDAIEKQEVYDEDTIKKKFSQEKFIKHLPSEKNYLYHLLLNTLESYNTSNSTQHTIKKYLSNATVLYDKDLIDQAEKFIVKAKDLAYKHELFVQLLEILDYEKKIFDNKALYQKLIEVSQERIAITLNLKNIYDYYVLNYEMLQYTKKSGLIREDKDKEVLKKILDNPLMANIKNASSVTAKAVYYQNYATYYYTLGEYDKAYEHIKEQVALIENHSWLFPIHYRMGKLVNFLYTCLYEQKYAEVKKGLITLRALPQKTKQTKVEIFFESNLIELIFCCDTGEFEAGVLLISTIQEGFDTYNASLNEETKMLFYFYFAQVYFGIGDYNASLKWVNEILNNKDLNLREDIYFLSKLLNLIVHFELGNHHLIEYEMRSTYRMLLRRNRLYTFEKILLDFLKKFTDFSSKNELIDLFKKLRNDLLQLTKNADEKRLIRNNSEFFILVRKQN